MLRSSQGLEWLTHKPIRSAVARAPATVGAGSSTLVKARQFPYIPGTVRSIVFVYRYSRTIHTVRNTRIISYSTGIYYRYR
jgi:hypothetical protein